MSASGLLLRVVLMLSLLLNGLNVAMAGPMALAMAERSRTSTPAPPCHGDAPMPAAHAHHAMAAAGSADTGVQAPHDGDHCKIKDCLRSCAQQPSLTVQIAWIATPPPLSLAPVLTAHPSQPMPPLDRITRPPIA
ncbi:CopL family metal-binding regulatory protein [Stenotrophomonas sp. TWI587]|uniref:CopL family metal-binding regulatory protein n=1 Tax=Stenotrophomonas sp. TWI587 TaxID=3136783 RepID=UPI00320A4D37